jgi:UDP-glucose 4-epimerase
MKKVIVTGGLGYVGSLLCKKLIKKGYKVIILDNFLTNTEKKIDGTKLIKCDITKSTSLAKINIKNVKAVLHLAAQSSGPKSFEEPDLDVQVNVLGTVNLINFCKKNKINKFIFASSFTVYGDNKSTEILNEENNCNPKSFYAVSKYASEKYLQILCEKFSIKWNILRMFNVYGPGQDMNRIDQGIVSIYLNYIKNHKILPVKGSLERFRDLIYIDDVLDAWVLCLEDKKNYNQIFNLGSGEKTYVKDMIKEIIKLYNKKNKIKVKVIGSTPGDIKGCYANITKIKKSLSFKPKIKFKKGIKLFKEWVDEI